jgi:signal transduction histidine kinase
MGQPERRSNIGRSDGPRRAGDACVAPTSRADINYVGRMSGGVQHRWCVRNAKITDLGHPGTTVLAVGGHRPRTWYTPRRARPPLLHGVDTSHSSQAASASHVDRPVLVQEAIHRGPERRRAVLDRYARVLQALDAGGVGTWEWDLTIDQMSVSSTHDLLFGYDRGSSPCTLEGFLERVHPDDRAAQRIAISQSLELGLEYRQEFRIVLPDGTVRWIQGVGRSLGSERTVMAGTSVDVTDRRRSEDGVRQTEQQYRESLAALYQAERVARAEAELARAEAEAANHAKTEFLAVMSHELRTPLNAIAGYTDLIALGIRGPVTPAQSGDLHRIQRSQQHLLGLINQILNYARLETGAAPYDVVDVLLDEALRDLEGLVRPQVSAKRIQYESFACDRTLTVRADPEALRQILLNLVSNALKFTDVGGRIATSCTQHADVVDIHIRDTGIGIPRDRLDLIFEPFVQVDARLTRSEGGVGLGLAISRDLALGMGGNLSATSELGRGSTFTLRLRREPTTACSEPDTAAVQ